MNFLLAACEHPAVLRVIYFGYLFVKIGCSVLPIGLIIMLIVDFSKAVISGKEDEQIKSTKLVGKRIMYAVLVFLVPWIVSVLAKVLSSSNLFNVNYSACLDNAINSNGDFSKYDLMLDLEEDELLKKYTNNNSNNGGSSGSGSSSGGSSSETTKPGNPATGDTYETAAKAMVNLALYQLGRNNDDNKYGGSTGEAWCAYFVNWLISNTTIKNVGTVKSVIEKEGAINGISFAGSMVTNFANSSNLEFHPSSFYWGDYTPKAGDIIFFWFPSTHEGKYWDKTISDATRASHVGIVEKYDGNKVYTVEGNASNQVKNLSYYLDDSNILGYGSWYAN